MEIAITYRSKIYIEGETLEEIAKKFASLNLDPIDNDDFAVTDCWLDEILSARDGLKGEDLTNEFTDLINTKYPL